MPRSLWTGSLSFGLVNVPVRLETAVRDRDLHFRQIHRKDGAPIEVRRWCSKEDVEVDYEEITHGYELDDGDQVTVSDLELQAIEPRRTRTIDIEQFVELADVDPMYFDHPYWLVPASDDDGAVRAYRLLTEVMGKTERAALGRFVMRAKEYLALVRERDGALTLTTMLFADETRSTKDIDAATQKSHKPDAQTARFRRRRDRGAQRGLGSRQVQGSLPRSPTQGRPAQGQGRDDRRARRGQDARAHFGPHGRPGTDLGGAGALGTLMVDGRRRRVSACGLASKLSILVIRDFQARRASCSRRSPRGTRVRWPRIRHAVTLPVGPAVSPSSVPAPSRAGARSVYAGTRVDGDAA